MPKIRYVQRDFATSSRLIIMRANEIIAEYISLGFRLTLRQLYYQFVSRDWLRNTQREYDRLGSIINDARLAGLIDWDSIEDRGRNLQTISCWRDPAEIIAACASQFKLDLWEDQPYRIEVWVEKEALLGVVAEPCRRLRIPHFACKGYTSQSEMWSAGHYRLRQYLAAGKQVLILHLGDHDPSGIDMTRDVQERLSMFAESQVEVIRLALNMDQVQQYSPPPNPAKFTDSRCVGYVENYGTESWELDALSPTVISGLIEVAVRKCIVASKWEAAEYRELAARGQLRTVSDNFSRVCAYLDGTDHIGE